MIEIKHFEFNIPHKCMACKKTIRREKEGTRLAPSGLNSEDLSRIVPRDLGQWIHEGCYNRYFNHNVNKLDKQRAIK